jgi:hypothetical protein
VRADLPLIIDWTLTAESSSARFCSASCTTDFGGAGLLATQVPCFFNEDFLPGLASGEELVSFELFRLNEGSLPKTMSILPMQPPTLVSWAKRISKLEYVISTSGESSTVRPDKRDTSPVNYC